MSDPTSDVPVLMVVHAHPDDESSSTGGTLARYAAAGCRTVLITCTDGRLGDAAGGVKPGQPGHDPDEVARRRAGELGDAAKVLGRERVGRSGLSGLRLRRRRRGRGVSVEDPSKPMVQRAGGAHAACTGRT